MIERIYVLVWELLLYNIINSVHIALIVELRGNFG